MILDRGKLVKLTLEGIILRIECNSNSVCYHSKTVHSVVLRQVHQIDEILTRFCGVHS